RLRFASRLARVEERASTGSAAPAWPLPAGEAQESAAGVAAALHRHSCLRPSGGLGDGGRRPLDRTHVDVEQGLVLLALVLVLLAQPDDLLQHLDIEAFALGFR